MVGLYCVLRVSYVHVYIIMIFKGYVDCCSICCWFADLCLTIVDLSTCIVCHIFNFWVSSDSGKYLFVDLIFNPVHVVYFYNLMALIHVAFFGDP